MISFIQYDLLYLIYTLIVLNAFQL